MALFLVVKVSYGCTGSISLMIFSDLISWELTGLHETKKTRKNSRGGSARRSFLKPFFSFKKTFYQVSAPFYMISLA